MKHTIYVILVMFCVGFYSTAFAAPSGDANGNGKLDLGDAIYVLQSVAGLRPAGNLRDAIIILQTMVGLIPDITPPSAPVLNPPGEGNWGYNFVKLWWYESTGDVGVAGYYIYRDEVQLGQTADTSFTDRNNITPSTVYAYQIKAFDTAGNISPGSNILAVTTPATPGSIDVSGNVNP
jgi:hypothetical protein